MNVEKQFRENKPSPKPKKDLKAEMGDVDYRKWADNWDPVVDVQKIKARVDTNYQKALELHQRDMRAREQLTKSTKDKRAKSARARKTYIDDYFVHHKRRYPSKEAVHRNAFFATNRYKYLSDKEKEQLHQEWKHISNIELLKWELEQENKRNAKSLKRLYVKEYSEIVKKENQDKINEQIKAGKKPGMYTAQLIRKKEIEKSKENNQERTQRRQQREERNQFGAKIHDLFGKTLMANSIETGSAPKQKPKKPVKKKNRNEDLRF